MKNGVWRPPFFFRKNIRFRLELGVRQDRTRLAQYLPALDIFTLGAAQQYAHVIARLAFIEQFTEHLHPGAGRLHGRLQADDLDFLVDLHDTAFDTARNHGATARRC